METIVVYTGWLVFISIFNCFVPTRNKDINNKNNDNKSEWLIGVHTQNVLYLSTAITQGQDKSTLGDEAKGA